MNHVTHLPVLYHEFLAAAQPQAGRRWVDGTFGRGGHASALLAQGCQVLALDRDADAERCAQEFQVRYPSHFHFRRINFSQMKTACDDLGWERVHGVLLDLGVSSPQLDTPERGFSFRFEGELDMRMDQSQSLTAAQLIQTYSETELADLFYRLGDEYESRRIARAIVRQRDISPIETTSALAALVASAVSGSRRHGKTHPATKVFQALRIAVNDELRSLESALPEAVGLLEEGGALAVISFHSGEDRYVKNFFRERWRPIDRSDDFVPTFARVERYLPTEREMAANPRARSARLRVAWKAGGGS